MTEQGSIRLADRILAQRKYRIMPEFLTAHWSEVEDWLPKAEVLIENSPVIDATNIKEYYDASAIDKQHGWSLTRDIPNCLPPLPVCFIEYKMPFGEYRRDTNEMAGALFTTSVVTPEMQKFKNSENVIGDCFRYMDLTQSGQMAGAMHDDSRTHEHYSQMHRKLSARIQDTLTRERPHYLVQAFIYRRLEDKTIGAFGATAIVVNEHGEPLTALFSRPWFPEGDAKKYMDARQVSNHFALPMFLAVSFMHCKNIKTINNEPPAKLSKAFQRRHGHKLLRYHTLEIQPMKKVLETEGGIAHNGLKKALHICRGHFATYTPDKPLFGRVTGTVWKPAHVRGNASEGLVAKDYRVKAPAA